MEYQHNNQQWRPRPPIQGNASACPTCSFPHFPFCPPNPNSFNQAPGGFQFAADHYSLPRPGAPASVHRPIGAEFVQPRPYSQSPYEYGGNGYVAEGVDRNYKRPRVDDFVGSGPAPGPVSADDERRLKLIREHGAAPGLISENKRNGFIHSDNPNAFRELESRGAESSVIEPPYSYSNNFDPSTQYSQHHGLYNPNPGGYFPNFGNNNHVQGSLRFYGGHYPQPPLSASPPPPLPSMDPPLHAAARKPPSLFPVGPPATMSPPCPPVPEAQPYSHSKSFLHSSTGFATQDSQGAHGMLPKQYLGADQSFPRKHSSLDKPTVVDASQLFKQPHRATRPDHFVIILRGLPGSGKSYLAKMLRDVEIENGGAAPRIHSMDDYFMIEVEKVEESDISKSSGSVRGKKPVVKTVMEYCYEPEMEEAYRSSMLKAFRKTLEEGEFTFIIVDDRNLRKADFAQFWAIAKSSGYEVYILEASYKDPVGCAARNVHGFTLDDIQKMAGQWEEAPSFHLLLDVKSLFSGDDLKKSGIQEVDMDMEDEDVDEFPSKMQGQNTKSIIATHVGDDTPDEFPKDGKSWNSKEDNATEVKELGRSKWSNELDEDDTEQTEPIKGDLNALSGLLQVYGKEAKSVRWGDQGGSTGFSISAAKKANAFSLEIGPGAGYNSKSNPLLEENGYTPRKRGGEPKKQSAFQEQLRAERESFKAVFSRRQQRIGLDLDEE